MNKYADKGRHIYAAKEFIIIQKMLQAERYLRKHYSPTENTLLFLMQVCF